MTRLASLKSLREVFGTDAPKARALLEATRAGVLAVSKAARERNAASYHPHPTYVLRMDALAELGAQHGVHGVEAIRTPRGYVEYLNTGDTYSVTLLRYPSGTYRVGCWGDVVESMERRYGPGIARRWFN